jgi:hypothetical protein
MAKNKFFFPHDSNARNDEKILAVRMRFGMEGYGIYFSIVEKLLESSDYVLLKDYNVIAFELRVGADRVKSVVEDFGLFVFTEDGKHFYSESLNDRMILLEEIKQKRKEAGIRGAEIRWNKQKIANAIEKDSKAMANAIEKNSIIKDKIYIKKEAISEDIAKKEEIPVEISLSNCKQPDVPDSSPNNPHVSIDFEKLICWFNETTKGVFGDIRSPLSDKRKKMLRARISEHGKESFMEVVNNAIRSDFMRGQNGRGWTANFDWLIKPTNYEKVLSGNYKNSENGNRRNSGNNSINEDFLRNVAEGIARGFTED